MKKLIVALLTAVSLFAVVAPETPAEAQYAPPPATYCCDAWGYRRCVINPSLPGSSCFCYGQGYGHACY